MKTLFFILSLALLYGVVGNAQDQTEMGAIATYQPFVRDPEQIFKVSQCPEGEFVTGVLLGWRQKDSIDANQCYWDGGNKYSCGFAWLSKCKSCTTGDIITKFHLFIKEVVCSDGSRQTGVPLQSSGNEKLLSCRPNFFVTGIEAIVTNTGVDRHAALLGMRLYCAGRSLTETPEVTESFGVHGLNWKEEMGSYAWNAKTVTAPDFVCEDNCKGEYGWSSDDEPDSRKFKVQLDTIRQRQDCPVGYALQTLRHFHEGPSFYEFGGGMCGRAVPDLFSEENMEQMRRDAVERTADLMVDPMRVSFDQPADVADENEETPPPPPPPPAPAPANPPPPRVEPAPCPQGCQRNAYGICMPLPGYSGQCRAGQPATPTPPPPAQNQAGGGSQPDVPETPAILPKKSSTKADADASASNTATTIDEKKKSWFSCSLNKGASPKNAPLFVFILLPIFWFAVLRRLQLK